MKIKEFGIPSRVFLPGLEIVVKILPLQDDHGQSDWANRFILVNANDPIEVMRDTLLHEIQHMLLDYHAACQSEGICIP